MTKSDMLVCAKSLCCPYHENVTAKPIHHQSAAKCILDPYRLLT